MKNVIVLNPLVDVSKKPSLADMVSSISADVYARYCRLMGYNTMFMTGTNDSFEKVEKLA